MQENLFTLFLTKYYCLMHHCTSGCAPIKKVTIPLFFSYPTTPVSMVYTYIWENFCFHNFWNFKISKNFTLNFRKSRYVFLNFEFWLDNLELHILRPQCPCWVSSSKSKPSYAPSRKVLAPKKGEKSAMFGVFWSAAPCNFRIRGESPVFVFFLNLWVQKDPFISWNREDPCPGTRLGSNYPLVFS